MIQTRTTWDDSGRDCDHCGGMILQRTDYETRQPPRVRYQCEECGCLWSKEGVLQRSGRLSQCPAAVDNRYSNPFLNIPERYWQIFFWGLIISLVLFFIVRFFGPALVFQLIFLTIVGALIYYLIYSYIR